MEQKDFVPLSVSQAQAFANEFSGSWRTGPAVKVVASPAGFPVPARASACGMIHRGIAYIAANNHTCRLDVARTLAHEAVGHFGLWRILGSEGTRRFEQDLQAALDSGNAALIDIRDRVRRLYLDAQGRYTLTPRQESCEIAAFAAQEAIHPVTGQFKPGFGLFKAVFARVAQWLRKDMGIPIPFTLTELQGSLVNAMRGLQAGSRLDGQVSQSGQDNAHFEDVAFSFAGEHASTADQAALEQARQLQGANQDAQDPEAIRQRTGWSKAPDGLWRFEISDDQARLLTPQESRQATMQRVAKDKLVLAQRLSIEQQIGQLEAQVKRVIKHAFGRSRRGEITPEAREHELDQAEDQFIQEVEVLRQRLSALPAPASGVGGAGEDVRLDEFLHHPALFDAYPALAAIRVTASTAKGIEGSYELLPGQKVGLIEIKTDLAPAQKLTVLLHEIQHAIQFVEGFATGGKVLTANVFLPEDVAQRIKQLSDSADEAGLRSEYAQASALREEVSRIRKEAGWSRYHRLAGEVEARNTEARQALTPAERLATAPESTADVMSSDVVVHFEALPTAAAFSFAGPQALTADMAALDRARRSVNAGQDSQSTRQATGWHPGIDTQWRYEVDDSHAFLKGVGTFGEIVMRRLAALGKYDQPMVVSDVLYHHALFAAYPALANLEVEFVPKGEAAKGQLLIVGNLSGARTVRIQSGLNSDEALSTLLHELQHAIQHIEQFEGGGDPGSIRQTLQDIVGEKRDYADFTRIKIEAACGLQRAASSLEIIAQLERNPASITRSMLWHQYKPFAVPKAGKDRQRVVQAVAEQAAQALRSEIQSSHAADYLQPLGYATRPRELRKLARQIIRELPQGNKDDLDTVQKLEAVMTQHEDLHLYRRLAGEIEARNTQARRHMSPAERVANPPEATADIKANEAITINIFKHFGASSMASQQLQADQHAQLQVIATGKRSPITGKPIFSILNAEGARVETVHVAATGEEAIEVIKRRKARAQALLATTRSPSPAGVPLLQGPEAPKNPAEPRSGWTIYRDKTDSLAEPDEFFYHLTTHAAARNIIREGLVPGAGKMFGGAYSAYCAGKAFLTDSTGVNYWRNSVEMQLQDRYDKPPAVAVVRIAKADVAGLKILPDLVGSTDARANAYFATAKITGNGGVGQETVTNQEADIEEESSPVAPRS